MTEIAVNRPELKRYKPSRLGLPRWRRVWLIAQRDIIGYLKTWGFWLSFLFPIILFGGLAAFNAADIDINPPKYETVLDETNFHGDRLLAFQEEREEDVRRATVSALASTLPKEDREAFRGLVEEKGPEAGLAELKARGNMVAEQVDFPEPSMIFVPAPAPTLDELRPYLAGDRKITVDGEDVALNGVTVIRGTRDAPTMQYWTRNFNNAPAERLAKSYLRELARSQYLESGGLSLDGYQDAVKGRTDIKVFDPTKASATSDDDDAVSGWDRAPFLIGAALGFFLLFTIFAGSMALLTSMIEEKMNKLLEMMLASVKFSEIMLGKMLGAAMLTLASVIPYVLVGIGAALYLYFFGTPEQSEAMATAFPPSTIVFSLLYLVLGYMFYATILISLGALAQSMQDAQTLSLPMVMVMMAGFFVIQIGLTAPDSSVVTFASIFPLTSPFAMMIRLATDPPLWQIMLSLALLFASVVGTMWLCARIFRHGVLSGGGLGAIKAWFNRTVLRRAA